MKIRFDGWKWFVVCLFGILLLSMLYGCKTTKYVPVTVTEYKDKYIHKTDSFMRTDSVWLHDSVSVVVRGDTVYQERWHYKDKYKYIYKSKTDTLVVRDSIPYKVYVEVEKEVTGKKKSGWLATWTKRILAVPIVGLIILLVAYIMRRKK